MMNPTRVYDRSICADTLALLAETYPEVREVCERHTRVIYASESEKAYGLFVQALREVCTMRSREDVATIVNRLHKHKTPLLGRLKAYLNEIYRITPSTEIITQIREHKPVPACVTSGCETCTLVREKRKLDAKLVILCAHRNIGDQWMINLALHAYNCKRRDCPEVVRGVPCMEVKRILDHEKRCRSLECSCILLPSVLRFSRVENDDSLEVPLDELEDFVTMSMVNEEAERRANLRLPDQDPGLERISKKRREEQEVHDYIMGFGMGKCPAAVKCGCTPPCHD